MKKILIITRSPGTHLSDDDSLLSGDSSAVSITKEEWLNIVVQDPELTSAVLGVVVWKPKYAKGYISVFGDKLKFDPKGTIKCRTSKQQMIQKMFEIAQTLSAALMDDKGALYMQDPGDSSRLLSVTSHRS